MKLLLTSAGIKNPSIHNARPVRRVFDVVDDYPKEDGPR
jgi:hypothetical protein